MFRTHTCNDLNLEMEGEEVTLCGWVNSRRDHGGVIFIDLRDRYGLTQIVSDPQDFVDAHNTMDQVRSEYVLKITGKVRPRPDGQTNKKLTTGEIEVLVTKIEILNQCANLPFEIDQETDVGEDIRLNYRYLDLRRQRMKSNMVLRHKVIKYIRDFMDSEDFIEMETPILIKGTPEGSREYIVPSRVYPGNFFVLPQSPQQLKQLLMIAGFDKYFQIARCFRDEDQRGDRQPEFTQFDVEMSFITEDEIMKLNEKLLIELTEKFAPDKGIMSKPFPIMTYDEAMNQYGSDSPDIRFEMKLSDISEVAKNSDFGVFKNVVSAGGVVKALKIEGGSKFTRKEIDDYEQYVKKFGAKGLANIVIEKEGLKSPIVKFFKQEELDEILSITNAKEGDIIFFVADSFNIACNCLGKLRLLIAEQKSMLDDDVLAYCWVKDFPMFEKDHQTGDINAVHHPFTRPKNIEDMEADPEKSIALAYDIVLNGTEVGGGSIRIHEESLQKKVFNILNISEEDAERRFGHMLRAFKYGAPPHGGIAWGLDRLVMLFAREPNIREVIAFPKDQKSKDLMLGAPSEMPQDSLDELKIKINLPKK